MGLPSSGPTIALELYNTSHSHSSYMYISLDSLSICTSVYVYRHVHICVCIYLMYIYIYTQKYTYIEREREHVKKRQKASPQHGSSLDFSSSRGSCSGKPLHLPSCHRRPTGLAFFGAGKLTIPQVKMKSHRDPSILIQMSTLVCMYTYLYICMQIVYLYLYI